MTKWSSTSKVYWTVAWMTLNQAMTYTMPSVRFYTKFPWKNPKMISGTNAFMRMEQQKTNDKNAFVTQLVGVVMWILYCFAQGFMRAAVVLDETQWEEEKWRTKSARRTHQSGADGRQRGKQCRCIKHLGHQSWWQSRTYYIRFYWHFLLFHLMFAVSQGLVETMIWMDSAWIRQNQASGLIESKVVSWEISSPTNLHPNDNGWLPSVVNA